MNPNREQKTGPLQNMTDTADAPDPIDEALEILQHSLGVDQYGRGRPYRDHFIPSKDSPEHRTCRWLADKGLMLEVPASELTGGSSMFRVTRLGIDFVREHSPAPPQLTKGQANYKAWLHADSGLKFIDWMKQRARLDPPAGGHPPRQFH